MLRDHLINTYTIQSIIEQNLVKCLELNSCKHMFRHKKPKPSAIVFFSQNKTKCPSPVKSNTFSWKRFGWLGFLPRASTATRPACSHAHTLTAANVTEAEDRILRSSTSPETTAVIPRKLKRIGIRKRRESTDSIAQHTTHGATNWYPAGPV
jgi:hypothetical protein